MKVNASLDLDGGTKVGVPGEVIRRVLAVSMDAQLELELLDARADLDGVFKARDITTGEILRLYGWHWEIQDLDGAFDEF